MEAATGSQVSWTLCTGVSCLESGDGALLATDVAQQVLPCKPPHLCEQCTAAQYLLLHGAPSHVLDCRSELMDEGLRRWEIGDLASR